MARDEPWRRTPDPPTGHRPDPTVGSQPGGHGADGHLVQGHRVAHEDGRVRGGDDLREVQTKGVDSNPRPRGFTKGSIQTKGSEVSPRGRFKPRGLRFHQGVCSNQGV